MNPLKAQPPAPRDIMMAVLWPNLLIAATIAIGMFDLVLLAALIWADEVTAEQTLLVGALVGALVCLGPLVAAVFFDTAFALRERKSVPLANWLARAATVTRVTSSALHITAGVGFGLTLLVLFAMPFGAVAAAVLAAALIAIPFANLALRGGARRMPLIAAQARRWARRHCAGCDYNISGLTRCPECGQPVAPPRRPAPVHKIPSIRV